MKVILLASFLCCALTMALADDSYFPIKRKAGDEGITRFESQWYGKSLQQMKEPRLPDFAKDANAEVYRLMILPTWGNSIVVRIRKHEKLYSLSARRLDGQAGYDPGKLVESKDFDLSENDSNALESLLKSLRFFEIATNDDVRGFDGDEWILEGVSQGKYHLVQRWCAPLYNPEKRRLVAFVALCKFLVDKSALSERPKNKGYKLI